MGDEFGFIFIVILAPFSERGAIYFRLWNGRDLHPLQKILAFYLNYFISEIYFWMDPTHWILRSQVLPCSGMFRHPPAPLRPPPSRALPQPTGQLIKRKKRSLWTNSLGRMYRPRCLVNLSRGCAQGGWFPLPPPSFPNNFWLTIWFPCDCGCD